MDIKSPKSEPAKSFEKLNTEKAEKPEITSKPSQKPDIKPKNKIEQRKIDPKKEPNHNLQPRKIDPKTPPRHKLESRKIDPTKEPKNKLLPRNIDPATPSKHKIESRKIDHNKEPKHKIRPHQITPEVSKNKVEQITSNAPVSTVKSSVTSPSKTNSFDNGKQKECGRCHQIKSIDKYGARMMEGKKIPFSRCKKCRIDINQIYKYNNKAKIIQNVYNGKLKGQCQMCSVDIKKLPSLEFHHLDPKLKSGRGISLSRNWEETQKQIEREKVTILCENCHTKQRSKYYNSHEKIIKENNLSPSATNNQISSYINSRLPNADYGVRRQVIRSIKKQIIINHLYEGKCVGCREVSTDNNLPALQLHHRDKNNTYRMSKTYNYLRNLEMKEIIEKLKEENCIPLCGNCHRMEQATQFKNNYEKIVAPEYWVNIKKTYEKIEKNIKNFKFMSE